MSMLCYFIDKYACYGRLLKTTTALQPDLVVMRSIAGIFVLLCAGMTAFGQQGKQS